MRCSRTRLYIQQLAAGRKRAMVLIDNYLSNQIFGSTWITFSDTANWNLSTFQGYLNRASITEYIQHAKNHDADVYFHTS